MDPRTQFCHNPSCHARGKEGEGNIVIHSQKGKRYQCTLCDATFVETKGTPFFRLQTDPEVVTIVLALLCHGCPIQAVVAAFGFDERTVSRWLSGAGAHCQKVQEHLVQQGGYTSFRARFPNSKDLNVLPCSHTKVFRLMCGGLAAASDLLFFKKIIISK